MNQQIIVQRNSTEVTALNWISSKPAFAHQSIYKICTDIDDFMDIDSDEED